MVDSVSTCLAAHGDGSDDNLTIVEFTASSGSQSASWSREVCSLKSGSSASQFLTSGVTKAMRCTWHQEQEHSAQLSCSQIC